MTSFVDDDGNYLDYSGDDFTITKQALSITDLRIKGDVSVNFSLDNNSVNRKLLGYFGPMQISSPALTKIPFNLIRNGNTLSRGNIVIQNIDADTLDCYFISGNTGWFNDFQFNIQELNLNDHVRTWNYTNMVATKSATGGIIFPLIDFAYKNEKFYQTFSTYMNREITENGSTEYVNWFSDFYPCFYLHTLIDEISKDSGYKFSGSLMTDALYLSALIVPGSGALKVSDIFIKQREAFANLPVDESPADVFATIIPFKEVYDGDKNLYSNYKWTSDGTYLIEITVKITVTVNQAYNIKIYKNGAYVGASGLLAFTGVSAVYTSIQSATPGDYYEVWMEEDTGLGFTYTISAGSSVLYTIKDQVIVNHPIIPNVILPSTKAIEVIKSIALRFCCAVTFDQFTKTISLNPIDKITTSEDWSDYLVGYKYLYQYGFKNNYIKVESSSEFEVYNNNQTEGYGGVNISTDFEVNMDQTLFTDPFGAARDEINETGHGMLQPYIELVSAEDGDSFTVTGVSNSGGFAAFTVAGFKTNQNETIIRVNCPAYVGYHIVSASTAVSVVTRTPYTQNSTGNLFVQNLTFNDTVPRLLTCLPNYDINKIGPKQSIIVYDSGTGSNTHTSWPFAYFNKPTTGKDIDQIKPSLSYGPINFSGYTDETMSEGYYSSFTNMLNNPIIRATLLIPESKFTSYNFDRRIYLSCKAFSGYFWIDNFRQYKDSKTLVEVDLRFM